MRFITGEGVILVLTAALAYISRHGKDSYGPVPNYLKQFDKWLEKKLLSNKWLANKGESGERIAGAIAGTTILMHGGNAFVPIKKWLQNRKETIVTHFNRRWGKPGEVEEGKERVALQGKETWGDVIKGRLVAWVVVFASFLGADLMLTDKKGSQTRYKFDEYNEKFGKWVAGLTKEGKEIIGKIPKGQALSKELEENKTFRFGKILALDVYATTAALFIWNAVSRISAMLRKEEKEEKEALSHAAASPSHTASDVPEAGVQDKKPSYRERAGDRPADFRALAKKEPVPAGMEVR